jgi:hypothetical protein
VVVLGRDILIGHDDDGYRPPHRVFTQFFGEREAIDLGHE